MSRGSAKPDRAKHKKMSVLKHNMRPGFTGVENELYYDPKCMMLLVTTKFRKLITTPSAS